MEEQKTNPEESPLRFKLNMRVIADALERKSRQILYYGSNDVCCLEEARMYYPGMKLKKNYVYLVPGGEVDGLFRTCAGMAFVIVGETNMDFLPENSPMVQVIDGSGALEIFEIVQDTFETYKRWDWRLQRALYSTRPLDEMVLASIKVFRNPMFIHDTNFFIISDPKHVPEMLEWSTDPRTGQKIVPPQVINDFMVDMVYLEGMKDKKAVMFPAEQRGYRILYYNLWNDGRYAGRILVDEIYHPIQPGDFMVLDYLGKVVETCLKNRRITWMHPENDAERFYPDFLEQKEKDERRIMNYLHYLCWNRRDHYCCLSIEAEQKEFSAVSSMATLGQIEAQISAGQAIYYNNGIVVVINLSFAGSSIAEILSKMAVLLRDSLLKVGVSSEIDDFMELPQAYRQACIALDFGRNSESMYWYYYFNDYMLEYIIDRASREIPVNLLCSDSLKLLKKYDGENHTDLYHTLKVYLSLDQNVLQTSKELYVHRSTVFYRLDRIQKLTGVNLQDARERLKLLISFYMLEKNL